MKMDRCISEVINICRDLTSEKGTERRKAAVKLKNGLSQSAVKKALDKNFEMKLSNKSRKVFTWENIFKTKQHAAEEKKSLEEPARAAHLNRERKKAKNRALEQFSKSLRKKNKSSF